MNCQVCHRRVKNTPEAKLKHIFKYHHEAAARGSIGLLLSFLSILEGSGRFLGYAVQSRIGKTV
jgi:hypothetical protein